MENRISKLVLLTEEIINYIPKECRNKKELENWLLQNPYSPYVTLYAGSKSLKFDDNKSFVSPIDNKKRVRINDNIYLKLENFESFDNKIISANGNLEDLIEASELFEHYPDFRKINLKINISYINNGYHHGKVVYAKEKVKKIEVNADNSINAMKILIHKIQNSIQLKENLKVTKSYFEYDEIQEREENVLSNFQSLEEANELLKDNKLFQEEITAYKNLFSNQEYYFENKNKYQAKLIYITPDEYIQAVKLKQPRHALDMRKIRNLETLSKDGIKFEIPYLRYGSIDIDEEIDRHTFGQEGYNRSIIAKDKKIDKIPTIVCYREDDESIPDFIKEKLIPNPKITTQEIYNKIFNENGKFKLDKNLREHIPYLSKSFKTIKEFKQNVPSYINSPVGKIHIDVYHAFNHMNKDNSTKIDRTKYNGNFLKELKNPLIVFKSNYNGKDGYYFYNISKDSKHNLSNTLHCLVKNDKGILEHKTFYRFESGLGKIKRFLNESEIVHCHKLLAEKSAINSEQIHYSNVDEIIQEKENKVKQENIKDVDYPKNIGYHGTNADFEEFSLNFNRKGIGANVFGFGVYCSESINIAKSYGMELGISIKIDGVEYNSLNPEHYAIKTLKDNCNVYQNALFELKRELKYAQPENIEFQRQAYELLKKEKDRIYDYKRTIEDNSIIYKIEIPNKKYFIKEGGLISSQPKNIIEILNKIDKDNFPDREALENFLNNKITGIEFYRELEKAFNDYDKKTSEFLFGLGIKGISISNYNPDEKSDNYVIFDTRDIKILTKETPIGIIEYKNTNNTYENTEKVNKLLSIVPNGIKTSFVKDFLMFNGISESFVDDIKSDIFINKEIINNHDEIKYNHYFTQEDDLIAKEVANIYIKTILDEKDEIFYAKNEQIINIQNSINIADFKDIVENIEINKIDNMKNTSLEETVSKEFQQNSSYEKVARMDL